MSLAPYAEVWGDSIAYDSTYQALTRLTERMRDLYKGKSPIIAAYTHRGKNASALSKDNELLTDAIIAASGGYHMTTAAPNTSEDAKGFGVIKQNGISIKTYQSMLTLPMQNSTTKNSSLLTKNFSAVATPWHMILVGL